MRIFIVEMEVTYFRQFLRRLPPQLYANFYIATVQATKEISNLSLKAPLLETIYNRSLIN